MSLQVSLSQRANDHVHALRVEGGPQGRQKVVAGSDDARRQTHTVYPEQRPTLREHRTKWDETFRIACILSRKCARKQGDVKEIGIQVLAHESANGKDLVGKISLGVSIGCIEPERR